MTVGLADRPEINSYRALSPISDTDLDRHILLG